MTQDIERLNTIGVLIDELILKLLKFFFEINFFLFDGKIFLQLRGTAIGSPGAPTYANLLLVGE